MIETIISYEDFCRDQRYNNFYFYFLEADSNQGYSPHPSKLREKLFYHGFKEQNPILEAELRVMVTDLFEVRQIGRVKEFQIKSGFQQRLRTIESKLYEAYVKMQELGATKGELFL